jgi:hypothetical protein
VLLKNIEKGLAEAAAVAEEETEKIESPKYETVILTTASGAMDEESPMFVLEFDINKMNHTNCVESFLQVIKEYNGKVKNKKKRITTIGDAFQFLPGSILKPNGFKIKCKTPLIIIRAKNDLVPPTGSDPQ